MKSAPSPVRIHDLTLAYDRVPAVHHLNGTFEPGSLTAIVGPNGAGKSTLLRGISGLISPSEGGITTQGAKRSDIAFLPQQSDIDRSFPISVFDTVSLGLWKETGFSGALTTAQKNRIFEALEVVGLRSRANDNLGTLSAGQLQRVLFARLLLQDASIILLDEPFATIDERTTSDLMQLVHLWHEQGRTVIAVLHDITQVRRGFPTTLLLACEPIGWGTTSEVLTEDNLARARAVRRAHAHGETA